MITDARVLQDQWVPSDVVNRHGEIRMLSTALDPIPACRPTENAFLDANPGIIDVKPRADLHEAPRPVVYFNVLLCTTL